MSEQELHRGGAARVEKYGAQPSALVPPVHLEIHPGQIPIGEHVDQAILPERRVADLGPILVRWGHGNLEVRQNIGEVRRAATYCAQLPR